MVTLGAWDVMAVLMRDCSSAGLGVYLVVAVEVEVAPDTSASHATSTNMRGGRSLVALVFGLGHYFQKRYFLEKISSYV